jgi:hypothetical protein
LSASAPSSHDLSLAVFTINIAESNFRHTQVAFDRHRTLGSTNIRFAPILLQSRKSNNPKTLAEVDL